MIGYTAFTDESGVKERYLCYGGIFVPTGLIDEAEHVLSDYAQRRGFGTRELSWKKCSREEVDRYIEFADLFWTIGISVCEIDFRSLVVDTHKYPLEDPEFDCHSEEDGFYRFYYAFVSRSLAIVADQAIECEVVVASTEDQYPYRTEILTATVGGALKAKLGDDVKVTEVQRESPRVRRLHQLADVLLGAVSCRYNRYDESTFKYQICDQLETRLGRALTSDFLPQQRPFNVWRFLPKRGLASRSQPTNRAI
jgi:hypothetical protein